MNFLDIATLRSKHRICGVLTGTLPHLSQQNVFLGVPLVLMPEEVVLLVELGMSLALFSIQTFICVGVAVLINDSTAHLQPTALQLLKWSKEQQNSMRSQLAHVEAKQNTQSDRALSEDALRKRKEREERKKVEVKERAMIETKETPEDDVEDENGSDTAEPNIFMTSSTSTVTPAKAAAAKLREIAQPKGTLSPIPSSRSATPTPAPSHYAVVVPASSSDLEWYSPAHSSASTSLNATSTYTTIDAARSAGVWIYPSTLSERARCGVFKGLWEQGYFMGVGIKFGGEYLVYPGVLIVIHIIRLPIDSP